MKHLNLLLASLCIGALTQAIAAEPPVAPAPQSTEVTAAPAAADNGQDSAAATADKAKADAEAKAKAAADKEAAQKKVMNSRGYKQVVLKNGDVLYCRREQKLGSMFDTEVCNSYDNIELQLQYAQDAVRQMHGGAQGTPGH